MIDVKNLRFSYKKGRETLHGLTFAVDDGEIFGFLGPNGSGKSTTQKILTGILGGYCGEALLFGQKPDAHPMDFRSQIGVLFEFPYLYTNLSALDNLNYFASFYPAGRRRNAAELLEMLEFKKDFLRKPVSSYSKGMRQRVSMARALIHNPRLLFLDEPTSGLDPATSMEIHKMLLELKDAGMAIFLTTHNMEEAAKLCDNVALLNEGIIVEYGNSKDICLRHNIHKRYRVRLHDGSIHELAQSEESARAIANWLAQDQIETIHSCEPTLETVFLSATGRSLS